MAKHDSHEATQVEFIVYQNAYEESFLWDSLGGDEDHRFGDVLIYPTLTRDDVTRTLLAALEQGDVSLYEYVAVEGNNRVEYRDIPRDEAVSIIRDPAYWDWETAPARVCLFLSDSGLERFRAMELPEFERRPKL